MPFKSVLKPGKIEEIGPTIKKCAKGGIEYLRQLEAEGHTTVSIHETVGFLMLIMDLTELTGSGIAGLDPGYFYCPMPPYIGDK